MGFWERLFKFLGKTFERGTLLVSGMQIGDHSNDSDKIVEAVRNYEVQRGAYEQFNRNEDTKTLQYVVVGFIFVIVIFILVIGIKMMLSKNKQVVQPQSIALTTLREGNRSVNSQQSA